VVRRSRGRSSRAQQVDRMRCIGVLMSAAKETDQQAGVAVFKEILHQLGWIDGRNIRVEIQWARGDPAEARRSAEELVALPADVIMVTGQLGLEVLLRVTHSVPIVFNSVIDPVGSGYVESLARPGGNATGFITYEYALTAKWVELLKQIAPTVTRVAVLRDPAIAAGTGQFAVIQSVAPSIGVDVSAVNMRDAGQIEQDIARFASFPNGGLILTGSSLAVVHQNLIVALAAKHKLPAVYYRRYFVTNGGLISYGYDLDDQYRGAARYVDRILKGEKPAELPVQAPTKYELVINLKTAKALGLSVLQSLLDRADEVIE
jgi:putative tryptophan/tyrosine transport system substrate-binding protein